MCKSVDESVVEEACRMIREKVAAESALGSFGEIGVFINLESGIPRYFREYSDLKRKVKPASETPSRP